MSIGPSAPPLDDDKNDPSFKTPTQENRKRGRDCVTALVKNYGFDVTCSYTNHDSINEMSRKARYDIETVGAAAIVSTIRSLSWRDEEDFLIWSALKRSKHVTNLLTQQEENDNDLFREVVLAYNAASTYPKKVQVLSILSKRPSSEITKFNCDKIGTDNKEDEEDSKDVSKVKCAVRFNPPVTDHMIRKARELYRVCLFFHLSLILFALSIGPG